MDPYTIHKKLLAASARNESALLCWPNQDLYDEYGKLFFESGEPFAKAMSKVLEAKVVPITPAEDYPSELPRPLLIPVRAALNSLALLRKASRMLTELKFTGPCMLLPSGRPLSDT